MNIQADICLWLVQIVSFFFILSISPYHVRGHPYITSSKGIGERGRKMAAYADIADIVGGWAKKIQVYADVIEGRSLRMCVCILVEERKEAGLVVHYIVHTTIL